MQSLFLSFDSSSKAMFYVNWVSVLFPLIFLSKFWLSSTQMYKIFFVMFSVLISEVKLIFLSKKNSGVYLIFSSLFMFIVTLNVFGLVPFIFTPTSHMVLTLFLSIPLWLGVQLVGWVTNFDKMSCHLVPSGTPDLLIPFLVLIESLSNFIRPFTLATRLTANMMAGHLLMTLLGASCTINSSIFQGYVMIFVLIFLLILEISVALIQSYVFMLLSSLYTEESTF